MGEMHQWRGVHKGEPYSNASEVEVLYFPGLVPDVSWQSQDLPEVGDLAELTPKILPVRNYSVNGGEAKFVVIRSETKLVVVIGPELCKDSEKDYYHRELVALASKLGGYNKTDRHQYLIAGGGSIIFNGNWRYPPRGEKRWVWTACFQGQSGDYGEFDLNMVLNPIVGKTLAKALGMRIVCKAEVSIDLWPEPIKSE